MRYATSSILLAALVLSGAACASASVKVVTQASPNPFSKSSVFHVQRLQFVDLKVDGRTEAEYMEQGKEDAREKKAEQWSEIKTNVQDRFATTVAAALRGEGIVVADGAGSGAFVVQPIVDQVETGYYRIPAWNAVARIYMTLKILGPDQSVVEELRLSDRCGFDAISHPTANIRLLTIAESLAEVAAEHIAERASGG